MFTNRTIAVGNTATAAVNNTTASRTEKITHKVTAGESVLTIAHRYGVTAANVLRWNNLSSNRVAVGRNLTIYVDNGGVRIQNPSTASTAAAQRTSTSTAANISSVATVQYKVKSGDSFYSIAQRYPGYSSNDLMRLNNRTSSALKVGQYIAVPKI